jgi:hypothetical protein
MVPTNATLMQDSNQDGNYRIFKSLSQTAHTELNRTLGRGRELSPEENGESVWCSKSHFLLISLMAVFVSWE